jgi:hypothetical protein
MLRRGEPAAADRTTISVYFPRFDFATNDIDIDPEGYMKDYLPEKAKKWIPDIRRGGIRE